MYYVTRHPAVSGLLTETAYANATAEESYAPRSICSTQKSSADVAKVVIR